ncbi:MAG TPA: hypothetical protein PKO33_10290 [Pyrinomonadaceae bacterium]|nr:hypothetical protein [Pyrinomonadaceae bacterium]
MVEVRWGLIGAGDIAREFGAARWQAANRPSRAKSDRKWRG